MRLIRVVILALLAVVTTTPAGAQFRRQAIHLEKTPAPAITLTGATPLLRHISLDCDLDRTRGREAADQSHSGSGWMAGGFASGVLLGLIGTGLVWAMANSSTATPDRVPDGVDSTCYRDGFSSKAKSKNASNALTGGLLGTLVLVVLVVSASSGSSY